MIILAFSFTSFFLLPNTLAYEILVNSFDDNSIFAWILNYENGYWIMFLKILVIMVVWMMGKYLLLEFEKTFFYAASFCIILIPVLLILTAMFST